MAQKTKKRQETSYQAVLKTEKYLGMNTFTKQTDLVPGESANLKNWDIYSGKDGDFLKTRNGTQFLKKASGATKRSTNGIGAAITWDVGSEEYLITQEDGASFYSQALLVTGNPVRIALATGGAFSLGSSSLSDLFISGDKLYVIHPSGNYVIRWTGSAFVAYPMGLTFPWIIAMTSANAGVISGSYTMGIEKVYQVSGVDMMASTPNRRTTASPSILAVSGTVVAKKLKITIQATELDNDSLWTHLRVWRSKNKNTDYTDPLNPLDPQGLDDELYEEALITKAEIGAGALTAIATTAGLPPGNVGTTAGKPAGVYTIEVNNLDSVFFNLIGIDRIELLPLPAATTGCFCGNRIFLSGIQDSALDDASKNNIWYSDYAGTKYSFQYNPLNFVDTGRDGQNMIRVMVFEKDVIGIKESKTGRIPSANPDLGFQLLDDKTGITSKNMASFIPKIGVAAITSSHGDFKILGYDLRWGSILNGIDVALPVRSYTSIALAHGGQNSIVFFNGKIFVMDSSFTVVLHFDQRRGWTLYNYSLLSGADFGLTFANGTRFILVVPNTHLVEVEIAGKDTDISTSTDLDVAITTSETTHCFQSNNGNDIIEMEYLSIPCYFVTGNLAAYPTVNMRQWPAGSYVATNFARPPSAIAASHSELGDAEYRLYIQPQTIGALKWCPVMGNRISFDLVVTAPAIMRGKSLHCIVDENGQAWGAFDPFQQFPTTNTDPTWAQ